MTQYDCMVHEPQVLAGTSMSPCQLATVQAVTVRLLAEACSPTKRGLQADQAMPITFMTAHSFGPRLMHARALAEPGCMSRLPGRQDACCSGAPVQAVLTHVHSNTRLAHAPAPALLQAEACSSLWLADNALCPKHLPYENTCTNASPPSAASPPQEQAGLLQHAAHWLPISLSCAACAGLPWGSSLLNKSEARVGGARTAALAEDVHHPDDPAEEQPACAQHQRRGSDQRHVLSAQPRTKDPQAGHHAKQRVLRRISSYFHRRLAEVKGLWRSCK